MSRKVKIDTSSFGESTVGITVVILIAVILFGGEPSIVDSARALIGKYAGTIPLDYIYQQGE